MAIANHPFRADQAMNFVLPTILVASALAISSFGRPEINDAREAAPPQVETSDEWNPDLAWVDPVITGPVSEEYARIRDKAACDEAVWPDVPKVCFPD